MGAAANQRGDKVIGYRAWEDVNNRQALDELSRMVAIMEDCNIFVRKCQAYRGSPVGMRTSTMEAMRKRKGWPKRIQAFLDANTTWIHCSSDTAALSAASFNRARAMLDLLQYELGSWRIPERIKVPRCLERYVGD